MSRQLTVQIAVDAPEAVEVDDGIRLLHVGSNESASVPLAATPRRLGRFAWPVLRGQVAGPLGLAWWSRRLSTNFTLKVVPDLLGSAATSAGALALGVRSRAIVGTGAELLQLREYRSGDPQHLIDWKATARGRRLVSRDFAEDQHLDIVVGVDAGRASGLRAGDLDRLGHFANLAARFAEHAVLQDDRVGLVLFADRPLVAIAPGRGTAAVLRIRRTLATASVVAAESNPLNAALRIRSLVHHRSLVVLLTDLDDATAAGQLASAARLLLPKHLPLIAGLTSPEVETLSVAPARSWLDRSLRLRPRSIARVSSATRGHCVLSVHRR